MSAATVTLAQMRPGPVAVEAVRTRGSFDRMVHDTALRRAAAPREELVGDLRAMVGSRRRAPGVTPLEPFLDVLVHGQDIALPLGISRPLPLDAATTAPTRVWTAPWPLSRPFAVRRRLSGLRLACTASTAREPRTASGDEGSHGCTPTSSRTCGSSRDLSDG